MILSGAQNGRRLLAGKHRKCLIIFICMLHLFVIWISLSSPFESDLAMAQPWRFALYNWRPEKRGGLLGTYFILLLHMPVFFDMTSLTPTDQYKMAAITGVLSWLWNVILFYFLRTEREIGQTVASLFFFFLLYISIGNPFLSIRPAMLFLFGFPLSFYYFSTYNYRSLGIFMVA